MNESRKIADPLILKIESHLWVNFSKAKMNITKNILVETRYLSYFDQLLSNYHLKNVFSRVLDH